MRLDWALPDWMARPSEPHPDAVEIAGWLRHFVPSGEVVELRAIFHDGGAAGTSGGKGTALTGRTSLTSVESDHCRS